MTINTKAVSMKEILTAPWIEARFFTSGKATMFVNPEHPHGYMHKSLDMAKGMYDDDWLKGIPDEPESAGLYENQSDGELYYRDKDGKGIKITEIMIRDKLIDIKVGDYVRWECGPEWFDGTVKRIELNAAEVMVHDGSHGLKESKSITVFVSSLKHAERPYDILSPDGFSGLGSWTPTTGTQTYDLSKMLYHGGAKITSDPAISKADPLDIEYDGVTLRDLLEMRECVNRERDIGSGGVCSIAWRNTDPWTWTPVQRAAVSAHWSTQLRAKIAASKERERNRVVVDLQDDDL